MKASSSLEKKWYLDSGCSRHMTGDKSVFTSFKEMNGGNVTFGDDNKCRIEGIGTIGNGSTSFIENVHYVNGLKHNLISISQLCASSHQDLAPKDHQRITDLQRKISFKDECEAIGTAMAGRRRQEEAGCS